MSQTGLDVTNRKRLHNERELIYEVEKIPGNVRRFPRYGPPSYSHPPTDPASLPVSKKKVQWQRTLGVSLAARKS